MSLLIASWAYGETVDGRYILGCSTESIRVRVVDGNARKWNDIVNQWDDYGGINRHDKGVIRVYLYGDGCP